MSDGGIEAFPWLVIIGVDRYKRARCLSVNNTCQLTNVRREGRTNYPLEELNHIVRKQCFLPGGPQRASSIPVSAAHQEDARVE